MDYINIKDYAKYIIYFFNSRGSLITNKKLQKLLYYSQAWHLVYFDENPLFEEVPEAWVHGAVYPSVYQQYKKFRAKPIVFDNQLKREELDKLFDSFGFNPDQKEFIDSVLLTYGKKEAFELEILNHREKPWLEAREGLEYFDISSRPISLKTMCNYYKEILTSSQNVL
ncbi:MULTISPECIES: Panacea domain-containing protein [Flavobacterium]|uniref:Panacea domain-containing protein n=1 Tax=Flavobacterium TaxID=237 RepID=UPI0011ECC0B0|nr:MULTISPECIES: type II toxin-antitoxin system antitoxin SocA domain-containing protein [Flavobacterium]WDF57575.1 DUF4065 domain-containing protein [Flavobacterium sp. KACC 22758]